MVAVRVVEERQEQHDRVVRRSQCVIRDLERRHPARACERTDRPRGVLFVVRLRTALQHVAALHDHREALLGQEPAVIVRNGLLGQDPRADLRVAHRRDPLAHRQPGDRLVGGPQSERVADLETEQNPERAPCHQRHDPRARLAPPRGGIHLLAPAPRVLVVLEHDERGGEARLLRHRPDPVQLALRHGPVVVGHDARHRDLEDPPAAVTDSLRDREELVIVGERAGHGHAVTAEVAERARRGETECTGLHRLAGKTCHLRHVLRRRLGVAPCTLVTHHVGAQRAVRQLHPHVHGPGAPAQIVHVLGERLPAPRHALVQGGARDVLHALHQAHEVVLPARAHGGETDPAVPGDHGGDAVRRGGVELAVPRDLAVVVGVDVHEPGRDDAPGGIDRLRCRLVNGLRDPDDAPVLHGHVGPPGRRARSVDDCPVLDDDVEHCAHPLLNSRSTRPLRSPVFLPCSVTVRPFTMVAA